MKKQSKQNNEVAPPNVSHDFEDNILTIKFRNGNGIVSKFHEGRILIESDKDGPISVKIDPFEV